MVDNQGVEYLKALLGKQLRIFTTDTRMFVGEMKCTDMVIRPSSTHLIFMLNALIGMQHHPSSYPRVSASFIFSCSQCCYRE